ncbi:MAG TPA: hypothetical protein VNO14_03245, partial [Blastocatellia bacterium]|nr:hypothetical protein [Blastocatellia bacterium]
MKVCPRCLKQFEDQDEARVNGWKAAFFVLLGIVIAASGAVAAYFSLAAEDETPADQQQARAPVSPAPQAPPAQAENPETLVSLAELAPEELIEALPKNLLRRFHAGEPLQGKPDDHRLIKDEKGEFIVLIGRSRLDGGPQVPAERILILQYGENQFRDVTKQLLPAPYSRGVITARQAQVKFESDGPTLIVREPAS